MVLDGAVALQPYIERRPLDSINDSFADVHARRTNRRIVLCPEE
jgi:6-hydroxycyclohex-1-ene-1-carbonyl-CoA dehydrogenase